MCVEETPHVLPTVLTSARTVMSAKLFILCCACAVAAAAPGIYDSYGGYGGYGGYGSYGYAPAIAAPVAHTIAAPIAHTIAAPAIQPVAHAIAAPVVKTIAAPVVHAEPIDPNPAYSFSYGVADPHTGDHKDAAETLQNGVVHGSYSLVEPDGHVRKVTYTADKVNGFNAVVERTGSSHAAPVAVAAPIAKIAVAPAPVAVAAPVAKYTLPAIGGHPWG